MTPGRTGGTGTDGERPLEHSVMKSSTENSLILRAFQMNPVRVLCLIYFGNSHLIYFFTYVQTALLLIAYFRAVFYFLVNTKICNAYGKPDTLSTGIIRNMLKMHFYVRLAKNCDSHLFTRQLTKIFPHRKPSMRIKTSDSN